MDQLPVSRAGASPAIALVAVVMAIFCVSLGAATPAAAGATPSATPAQSPGATGPRGATTASATAVAYLQARAAAVAAADPAAVLAPYLIAGGALARTEARIAAGAALRLQETGRTAVAAACRVTVLDVQPADDGVTASVGARAVASVTWNNAAGKSDTETSGVEHTLTLRRSGDQWVVVADSYADDTRAACLEAAGASAAAVRAAAHVSGRAAADATPVAGPGATARPAGPRPAGRGAGLVTYDRPAAQAYGDAYALGSNPTYVCISGADDANFASQCARAGGMPLALAGVTGGWWYSKAGTASPVDDTYSLSWVGVPRLLAFWSGKRVEWETSAGALSRGDFVFYDWTGDGVWDHVAMVAGTNAAGQKVVDAHSTDRARTFWKLGTSSSRYRFAKVQTSWTI